MDMRGAPTQIIRGELGCMRGKKRNSVRVRPRARAAKATHSEDGVDLTLIRWMLSLTPADRLDVLQQHARSVLSLRGEKI